MSSLLIRMVVSCSRLDKSASISGLRVECREMEKFSIINRFAKFHGRGRCDSAETASVDVNTKMQIYLPQRYVNAIVMPKTLPGKRTVYQ